MQLLVNCIKHDIADRTSDDLFGNLSADKQRLRVACIAPTKGNTTYLTATSISDQSRTRNPAVTNKPRDAFVQMGRGSP